MCLKIQFVTSKMFQNQTFGCFFLFLTIRSDDFAAEKIWFYLRKIIFRDVNVHKANNNVNWTNEWIEVRDRKLLRFTFTIKPQTINIGAYWFRVQTTLGRLCFVFVAASSIYLLFVMSPLNIFNNKKTCMCSVCVSWPGK